MSTPSASHPVTGAVTSDHPLATQAGAAVLAGGGNAVDAALAMAAVLCVTRPHMCGPGGDAFLVIREAKTKQVHVLNGSGRAGSRATIEHLRGLGHEKVPALGPLSVSVPGAVRAWGDAHARFATRSWANIFDTAIALAEDGIAVSPCLAADFFEVEKVLQRFPALASVYAPDGAPLRAGAMLRQGDLAATLRRIANDGPDALYTGPLARAIAHALAAPHGVVDEADLAAHRSTWEEPIAVEYCGKRVLAAGPSCQGLTLLQMLAFASACDGELGRAARADDPGYVDLIVRIARRAHEDRWAYLADPAFASVPVARLLSAEYAQEHARRLIDDARQAANGATPRPANGSGDTVYASVVDAQGNAVSLIQSLFNAFGSGVLVPGTGIVLHNRGQWLWLDETSPNALRPGKRPFHTLTPALSLNADGSLHAVFGTPGGLTQPQALFQVLEHVLRFGDSPQAAIDRARWFTHDAKNLFVEPGFSAETRAELGRRGNVVHDHPAGGAFGGAQMILAGADDVPVAVGADTRREAHAAICAAS